jgi:outer membrane protein assembly factor BamB
MADVASESVPGGESQQSHLAASPAAGSPGAVRPRIWPGVLIVAAYWAWFILLNEVLDLVISMGFMLTALGVLLSLLLFFIWWLAASRVPLTDRFLVLAVAIGGAIVTALVSTQTLGATGALFFGLPAMITVWSIYLVLSGGLAWPKRRVGLLLAILALWGGVSLTRIDGVEGKLSLTKGVHFRWTPTAEQEYLAERSAKAPVKAAAATETASEPLVLTAGDWPGFRGPSAQGAQEHPPIATNWSETPPKLAWKRRIGPAWSSFVVIGDKLFTQEQRGEDEATVCLDSATGDELWAHIDKARFWDGQAGAGPRATPTFHDGKLYTFGATGLLDCLDAATGKLLWQRDVVAETKAPLPMWGFSSSPLIASGVAIVYAGGPEERGLVAYDANTGEPAWHAPSGPISYSSAQEITVDGQKQVLLLSDTGVIAVDPANGKTLWNYDAPANGIWRVVQPRQFKDGQVLVGSEDLGLRLLNIARDGEKWAVTEQWNTKNMRPAFNDYVVVDDVAYGFDKGMFCATDLVSGKRLWKGGRYGFGQVLLLNPQKLLVVLSEQGEVVLLAANPKKLEELGRFPAITGKTWNHPVVVRNRLYVRNDTEIAAFELSALP